MSSLVRDSGTRQAGPVRGSGRTALRYLLIGLLALPIAGLTFATASSVATLAHRERTEPVELVRTGVASVHSCVRYGPVSRYGFGTWYTCRSTVAWSDGSVEAAGTEHNFFQGDEVGQNIQVGQIRTRAENGDYHPVLIRAEWPNNSTFIVEAIAMSLVAALVLLAGIGYVLAGIVATWSWRRSLALDRARLARDQPQ